MTSILYAEDASLWKDHFGSIGGLKHWLLEDRQGPVVLNEKVRGQNLTNAYFLP